MLYNSLSYTLQPYIYSFLDSNIKKPCNGSLLNGLRCLLSSLTAGFYTWNPHNRRRELTLASCPDFQMYKLWKVFPTHHTHTKKPHKDLKYHLFNYILKKKDGEKARSGGWENCDRDVKNK